MSMPASSCIFIASKVASSLPASSSAPESRQAGHNLSGSASQDGFGKLPATVVGNILLSFRFFSSDLGNIAVGKIENRWRPAIDPVEASQQPLPAQLAHHHVADPGFRSGQPIDASLTARQFANLRD